MLSAANIPKILILTDVDENKISYLSELRKYYMCFVLSRVEDFFSDTLTPSIPGIIVCDYSCNTRDLLLHIRAYTRRRMKYEIPMIIIQREADEALYEELIDYGHKDIIRAPFRSEEVLHRIALFCHRQERYRLAAEVDDLNSELHESYLAMIFSLAELTESRDKSTGNHLQRITLYSELMAEKLRSAGGFPDIDDRFIRSVYHMSALHDIGKVGIPDSILLKEGPLTTDEFEVIKEHPLIGGRTIDKVLGEFSISSSFRMGRDIALYHHERWDGGGYPEGLMHEEIPLSARIVALADVFDALSVARVYKSAMSAKAVREIIIGEKGRAFDPNITEVFLSHIHDFEKIRMEFKTQNTAA